MLKHHVVGLFLFLFFSASFSSEISYAKSTTKIAQKKFKRSVAPIARTPRVKAKKFIYKIETDQLTHTTSKNFLPSQVALSHRKVSRDGSVVSLRSKPKIRRFVASESN